MKLLLAALLVGYAAASCPNSCSGHGNCGGNDICTCFARKDGTTDWLGNVVPAFIGADCSLRTCPYQLAWFDVPDADNHAHQKAECSNRGECDRKSGECVCYPGYEGRACDRSSCPGGCNGHGTCQSQAQFAQDERDRSGKDTTFIAYDQAWDAKKIYACKCELGYRGADCSQKECPSATDPQGGPSAVAYTDSYMNGGAGTQEYRDCSGRGVCDYSSGLCSCFKGFYGEDCALQSALV